MPIRWSSGLRDTSCTSKQMHNQSCKARGSLEFPILAQPGQWDGSGIPVTLCAPGSSGTGSSLPQEHVKQHRGLSVGVWRAQCGCLGDLGVQMRARCGHGGIRGTVTAPAAAELQPRLHPCSPRNSPTLQPELPGVGKAASQGRQHQHSAELEAPAPLPGSHPGRHWDNIGSLRHSTRTRGYEPALNPSKELPLGRPHLAKGCLPRLPETISSTLFFLTLSNKTEETLRAKAIPQKKEDKPPFMEIETGLFPRHSLSSMARSQ